MRSQNRDKLFRDILDALRRMPETLAEAFILSHYRGATPSEIARELGIAEERVPDLVNEANRFFYSQVRGVMELAKSS